ncbi:MAG: hypothetical protein JST83_11060 [Bacteroidetes bacterium]|nr:hypothetical protein [Bacteroidota bacterium]
MKTRTILALIGLALVLVGFCLPWLDFYGHLSGKDIVMTCWPSGPGFGLLNVFALFVFLPVFAVGSFILVGRHCYGSLLLIQLILMDILVALGLCGISSVAGGSSMMYGFVILLSGIAAMHAAAIWRFVERPVKNTLRRIVMRLYLSCVLVVRLLCGSAVMSLSL